MAELDAGSAFQFQPCVLSCYVQAVVNPLFGQVAELCRRSDAAFVEHSALSPSDAPHIFNGEFFKYLAYVLGALHQACTVELGVFLAQFAGDFCKGFQWPGYVV